MVALPFEASLLRRGSIFEAAFRLEAGPCLVAPVLFLVVNVGTRRVTSRLIGCEGGGGGMRPSFLSMESCWEALLTVKGEGLSGRLTQSGYMMRLKRGATERSTAPWPEIFVFRLRQSAASLEDNNVLTYLSAWLSF